MTHVYGASEINTECYTGNLAETEKCTGVAERFALPLKSTITLSYNITCMYSALQYISPQTHCSSYN